MKTECVTITKDEYEKLLTLAKSVPALIAENKQLKAEAEHLKAENRLLRDKVDLLVRRVFGTSSEKLDPNQLLLDLGEMTGPVFDETEEVEEAAKPACKKRKRNPKKDRLPDNLPEERIVIDPPEVQANPEDFRLIGSEETVKLDVDPMRFKKKVTVRNKYVRKDNSSAPVIAPAPAQLIQGSFASASLLARICTGKFADHLPLYRQEQIFARDHIILSRKTMCSWVWRTADWLRIIYDELRRELLERGYLQIDETEIKYLSPGNGKTKRGYLWVYHAPGIGIVFEWHASRASECLDRTLGGFDGVIQTDGYTAYVTYNNARPDKRKLTHACCWAHARRKFHEARNGSPLAKAILKDIQELYRVESELRESDASIEKRVEKRRSESAPVLAVIKQKLENASLHYLPKSPTRKAINYTLERWDELSVYLTNGEVEIDNNLIENAIRPSALGKKNWMFFGSKDGGWQNAVMYTIMSNCKMHGINPEEYLKDVLCQLPHITADQARQLTPAKWLAARQQAASCSA